MEHLIAKPEPHIPAERILVIQFRQIGDVLLSTPVLRALRCYYPQSYIAFLTEPAPGRVLQGNPLLDEVIIRPRHATWRQQWHLLRSIRRQRFDLVIDLIGNPRSALLTYLSGATHRLAFARFPRSLLYTLLVTHHHPVPEYTVAKRLRLLELWGPGEEAEVQAVAAAARSRPALIPAWGLDTLAALLARADLLVGCNSAPLHIAVSQGTPTVTIMGATYSASWVPPAPQHRAVSAGLPCQPCEKN